MDYYNLTVFEWVTDKLGAQGTLCGGGRYDGLVETLGGPPTPGIGFALGSERLAMILEALQRPIPVRRPAVFLVSADEAGAAAVLRLSSDLRKAGVACDLDARGGKLARQFKQAERVGARTALVLGSQEVAAGEGKLKDMATRQETVVKLASLAAHLKGEGG